MKSIANLRKSQRHNVTQTLCLPPGFRKIFMSQTIEIDTASLFAGETPLNNAIQDCDPSSANFGKFFPIVGYDDIS